MCLPCPGDSVTVVAGSPRESSRQKVSYLSSHDIVMMTSNLYPRERQASKQTNKQDERLHLGGQIFFPK